MIVRRMEHSKCISRESKQGKNRNKQKREGNYLGVAWWERATAQQARGGQERRQQEQHLVGGLLLLLLLLLLPSFFAFMLFFSLGEVTAAAAGCQQQRPRSRRCWRLPSLFCAAPWPPLPFPSDWSSIPSVPTGPPHPTTHPTPSQSPKSWSSSK